MFMQPAIKNSKNSSINVRNGKENHILELISTFPYKLIVLNTLV